MNSYCTPAGWVELLCLRAHRERRAVGLGLERARQRGRRRERRVGTRAAPGLPPDPLRREHRWFANARRSSSSFDADAQSVCSRRRRRTYARDCHAARTGRVEKVQARNCCSHRILPFFSLFAFSLLIWLYLTYYFVHTWRWPMVEGQILLLLSTH